MNCKDIYFCNSGSVLSAEIYLVWKRDVSRCYEEVTFFYFNLKIYHKFYLILKLYFSGTIFRLKGAIQCMSFLDCNGMIIPTVTSGAWRDSSKDDQKNSKTQNTTRKPL